MTQLEELRILNKANINYLKKLGLDCKRNEIISKILEDDNCFSKMNREDAYAILEEIGVKNEDLNVVYFKLI